MDVRDGDIKPLIYMADTFWPAYGDKQISIIFKIIDKLGGGEELHFDYCCFIFKWDLV